MKTICVVGPTASGKTKVGVRLAKEFDGEIISGDSIQVYRELNIGSAKVTKDEAEGVVHHMIDIKSCFEGFSAGEFSALTKQAIIDIKNRNKTPIVVGGTGLFIKGLIEGYDYSSCPQNKEFRDACKKTIEKHGLQKLYDQLKTLNPTRANQISPNDQKRIIRALEIEKFSDGAPKKQPNLDDFLVIGLKVDRQKLYDKINKRVDEMVEQELIKEVQDLFQRGLDEQSQSMKGIGYKELFPYFRGEKTKEECIEQIKQHSRQFAKRQLTWFSSMPYIKWFENTQIQEIINHIKENI